LIEAPTVIHQKRGGSTIRERPDFGGGLFGNVGLPRAHAPPSTKGTSFMDLSSIDVKSSGLKGSSGKGSRQALHAN